MAAVRCPVPKNPLPVPPVPDGDRDPGLPAEDCEFVLPDNLSTPELREEPDPGAERPQLSLVGTVVGDDTSLGVFIDPSTQAALRLKIGDDFQGWKLRSVRSREVTLTLDSQTAILSLPEPDAIKAAEPAPVSADKAKARHSTENARSLRQKSQR
jgi:general secretion pathway protein N